MKRTLFSVVIIILVAVMTGTAASAASGQQQVTITVTVVDQNDEPIANTQLEAIWNGGSSTAVTKSNGKAFLDVPAGADVEILVSHNDYTRNLPYELTDASAESITIEVAEKAEASITVSDSDGPVEDARVRFWQNGQIIVSKATDTRGVMDSGVIEAGEYRVTVTQPGYYRESVRLTVRNEAQEEIQIEHGTVTVTFNVLDENFNPPKPVAGASITGDEIGSVRTQANGVQQVSIPVNSKVEVTVEKDGFETVTQSIAVKEENTNVEISTRKNPDISFGFLNDRVVVGEQIHVTITDQYGQPVEDSVIYLDGNRMGKTDENGVLLVKLEEPGEHTVYAESGSLSSETHTVTGVVPMEQSDSEATPIDTDDSDEAATNTPAAIQSGMVSLPGIPALHVESTGIGLGIGAALVVVITLFLRLRRPTATE